MALTGLINTYKNGFINFADKTVSCLSSITYIVAMSEVFDVFDIFYTWPLH